MNFGMSKQTALLVVAIVAFAAVGLLAVMPTHAQSTTTSSASATYSGTGLATYASGHHCPNMDNSTGSSSSTSSSATTG